MKTSGVGGLGCLLLLSALALPGCDRRGNTTPKPSTESSGSASSVSISANSTPGSSKPGSSTPLPGIVPQSENVPVSGSADTAAGPAAGKTAVGGLVSNQDSGGAKKGSQPSPTSGDGGAASGAH